MSRVFLAEESRLSRQVVVKLLPPEMGAGVNAERFEREIQLAARLQHPHIVPLLTAGASGDLLYYIMPYISGESLRVKLSREGELPVSEAVRILRELVDALAYAHRNGVVHRDIKPDNVLLSEGHAVVTDFGVAAAVSATYERFVTQPSIESAIQLERFELAPAYQRLGELYEAKQDRRKAAIATDGSWICTSRPIPISSRVPARCASGSPAWPRSRGREPSRVRI